MKWNYLIHLLGWGLPVLALQWLIGRRIFVANWRSICIPTALGTAWFSAIDLPAIRSGLWHFDERQILGVYLGPVPIEELLFFAVTSLLVSQSLLLFLPARMRRPSR